MFDTLIDWLGEHRPLVYGAAASFILAILGVIGGTMVVVRMRPDALIKKPAKPKARGKAHAAALHIGKNILGWLLVAAGIAMMVLPGPGLVVLLLGLTMVDFPGKHRAQLWILSRRRVLGPINRLRKRFKQPPLKVKAES